MLSKLGKNVYTRGLFALLHSTSLLPTYNQNHLSLFNLFTLFNLFNLFNLFTLFNHGHAPFYTAETRLVDRNRYLWSNIYGLHCTVIDTCTEVIRANQEDLFILYADPAF